MANENPKADLLVSEEMLNTYHTGVSDIFSKKNTIADVESTSTSSKAYAVGELLYYEGVLYKVTNAIAQGDTIVTSGSGQNVEVTTVDAEFGTRDDELSAITNVYGAKNLMPNTGTNQVVEGITFTKNSDGSVTINGDGSNDNPARFYVTLANENTLSSLRGVYTLSMGIARPVGVYLSLRTSANTWLDIAQGDTEATFTFDNNQYITGLIQIYVAKNTAVTNLTIYPMLRDARIVDDTYAPYAMTNRELTDANTIYEVPFSATTNADGNVQLSVNGLNFNAPAAYIPLFANCDKNYNVILVTNSAGIIYLRALNWNTNEPVANTAITGKAYLKKITSIKSL